MHVAPVRLPPTPALGAAVCRHFAAQQVPRGLLPALLAPSASPDARAAALHAAAALSAMMPDLLPLECCEALVGLLDAPPPSPGSGSEPGAAAAAPTSAAGGGDAGGMHAVACLLAMLQSRDVSDLRQPWRQQRGTERLRSLIGRAVAAVAAAGRPDVPFPASQPAAAGRLEACLSGLAKALRLLHVLLVGADFVPRDVMLDLPRWDAATASSSGARA